MRNLRSACTLLLAAAPLAACGGDVIDPPAAPARTCDASPGVTHTGTVAAAVWSERDNPHIVRDTVRVTGILTIEPGALICGEADAAILITSYGATIEARGTAALPIVFTASDPARPWHGIHDAAPCLNAPCMATVGVVSNARIEHARYGLMTERFTRADSVHFRQIRCTAAHVGHLARSRVDSAGLDGCAAVVMNLGAVFEDNVILDSGGTGLQVGVAGFGSGVYHGSVAILGGRIEGSAGVGMSFLPNLQAGNVSSARPVRIVNGGQRPVRAPLDAVATIWPTIADQDSLTGNASDTVSWWAHGSSVSTIVLGPSVIWNAISTVYLPESDWGDSTVVRMAPGSAIVTSGVIATTGALVADGMTDSPVSITGDGFIRLLCNDGVAECDRGSRIVHANVDVLDFNASQRLTLDHVRKRTWIMTLAGNGSIVTNSVFENSPFWGLEIRSGITISDCIVTGNTSGGIRASDGANVSIHNCSFESNDGPGVSNLGNSDLDARFNWWGDPAGPLGPAGDGVSGNVDYSSFLVSR